MGKDAGEGGGKAVLSSAPRTSCRTYLVHLFLSFASRFGVTEGWIWLAGWQAANSIET
jgi:hypothetical protein